MIPRPVERPNLALLLIVRSGTENTEVGSADAPSDYAGTDGKHREDQRSCHRGRCREQ